jgi:hypothetical protein
MSDPSREQRGVNHCDEERRGERPTAPKAAYETDGGRAESVDRHEEPEFTPEELADETASHGRANGDAAPNGAVTETVVLPFPVEVFPAMIQRFVREGVAAMQCAPDFFGVAALGIASGVMGTAWTVQVKADWVERPLLYLALIASAGAMKTPPVDRCARVVHALEKAASAEWQEAMKTYRADMKKWEAKRDGDPPQKPVLERIIVDDVTVEALARVLDDNPRGLLSVQDELTALIQAMNQFKGGRGSDRQFWLKVWSGSPHTIDRRKDQMEDRGPLRLENPYVTVFGNIIPENVPTLSEERGKPDGFLDRFLFSYPETVFPGDWSDNIISPEAEAGFRACMEKLRAKSPAEPLLLTPDARREWIRWYNGHNREVRGEHFPIMLIGPWAKLRGYCARLALIVHAMRWACGEAGENIEAVDAESVRGAVQLIEYFKSHACRVYRRMPTSADDSRVERIADWLRRKSDRWWRAWQVANAGAGGLSGDGATEKAQAILDELHERGLVHRRDEDKGTPSYKFRRP